MINHGNRGVPSFRIQISSFSYKYPISSTVHEPPKLELYYNDKQIFISDTISFRVTPSQIISI